MKTEGMTGNIVFVALVAALIVGFIAPVIRSELSSDALTNIAVGSQQGLLALAAAAAGYHWRGRVQKGEGETPPEDTTGDTIVRVPTPSTTTIEAPNDPTNPRPPAPP